MGAPSTLEDRLPFRRAEQGSGGPSSSFDSSVLSEPTTKLIVGVGDLGEAAGDDDAAPGDAAPEPVAGVDEGSGQEVLENREDLLDEGQVERKFDDLMERHTGEYDDMATGMTTGMTMTWYYHGLAIARPRRDHGTWQWYGMTKALT